MPATPKPAASTPPTHDEADRRLEEGLGRLDFARAEGLRRGSAIQATQAAGAVRERDRLAAKYGAEHPRVRAAEARVASETRLASAVAAQADVAQTPAPRVDAGSWVVQGRVLCADGSPAPGLTLSLFFPSAEWDRASGHVCTDHNGAFTLRTTPTDTQPRELVVSQGGEILQRDPRPLTPAPGTVATRAIVLDARAGVCPPPDSTGHGGGTGGSSGGGSGGGGKTGHAGGVWSVRGRVTDADGRPAAGLTVNLYDADLIFDDRLGQTTTNADGDYHFTYRTGDFRDLIERRPDLYLQVLGENGELLYSPRRPMKAEAGREEVIDLKLPRRKGE